MIYEIRTYQVKVGSLAEVEKRFGEAYEYRKKYSPLAAFWHTEVGPLNEIIHVWPYTDAAERARVRAEAAKDPNWPPKIQEFILKMQSEVWCRSRSCRRSRPARWVPIFEMRCYAMKPGTLPDLIKRWEGEDRRAHQAVAAGHGRPRRVRRGQPLHPHLGLQEHG